MNGGEQKGKVEITVNSGAGNVLERIRDLNLTLISFTSGDPSTWGLRLSN